MRSLPALAVMVFALLPTPCLAQPAPVNGNLYFFGAAVDAYPPKGKSIADYNWMVQYVERALKANSAELYKNVETHLVLDQAATHDGVRGGLVWLKRKMTSKDVGIIYLESHGGTDPKKGYGMSCANETTLYGSEIKAALENVPGRVVLFVDACGAGGIVSKHPQDKYNVPEHVVIISACRAKESAWGQLLGSVMEALYGRGDDNNDGVVTLGELTRHVSQRVTEFTAEQHAVTSRLQKPGFDPQFPIAKVSTSLVTVNSESAIILESRPMKSLVYFPGKWISDNAVVDNSSLKPVRSSTSQQAFRELTLNSLVGDYRRMPVENGWHNGKLAIENEQKGILRWTNQEGVSWLLQFAPRMHLLKIGKDCTYYDENHDNSPEIVLKRGSDGELKPEVAGFTFTGELYRRLQK